MIGSLFDPTESDDPVIIESYICESCGSVPAVNGITPGCRDPYGCASFLSIFDDDVIELELD